VGDKFYFYDFLGSPAFIITFAHKFFSPPYASDLQTKLDFNIKPRVEMVIIWQ